MSDTTNGMTEPRTTANIIEDLLEFVKEREYEDRHYTWSYGGEEWRTECPECCAEEGADHDPDCKHIKLIREAKAFLEVEAEIAA